MCIAFVCPGMSRVLTCALARHAVLRLQTWLGRRMGGWWDLQPPAQVVVSLGGGTGVLWVEFKGWCRERERDVRLAY